MLTREENDFLTKVEGDAPMGTLMRQHWVPVCLIEEVEEPDGTPILVEAIGRRYVCFRDTDGRVGLLDELCPHRKASLVFGRNEECGLRCLYHGWKFDVDGNCVSMASEPEGSPMHGTVKHRSYPVRECAGFIWAWLDTEKEAPEFERPPFSPDDATTVSILKIRIPANWAQITEGQIDSAHSSSLHSSDMVPARVPGAAADDESWYRPSTDKSPRMQAEKTSYGFHYAAIRKPMKKAATHNYLRITEYVAPFISLIPPNSSYNVATVIVPINDETSQFHFIAWGGVNCPTTEQWRKFAYARKGVDVDERWVPKRTMENNFLQDRQAMKLGDFTGIQGIPNQDIAMWVSMGARVDRSTDLLGSSDLAIVEFRRLMSDAARRVGDGEPAIGTTEPRVPQVTISSKEGVYSKETDWRTLGVDESNANAAE
ncbi:Rieske 2Fe-2S domain-containing protein [Rhodobium gokarnense]|uniref:Phthalate 4,5-dioxygenase oxygenase subunit n=1 Tax=Rhodobium gokarnense TaxID=364296 RepID=A0ABT3HAV9_9HYPH|nr:Rieske 2Fe-2S domain-containing protein [Rhodobium gokarnense]MCW2307539.1 phthalate 4,5-dioxygenase oxygenase subunit [Rhodobium gokarnense]